MDRRATPRATVGVLALSAAVGLLLAGCAGQQGEPMDTPNERPPLTATPIPEKVLPTTPPPVPEPTRPVPESVLAKPEVQQAITAEAERLGVERSAVKVVLYQAVTWPDGSLGCPEPGKLYTQALVEGHRLVLSVAGNQASYHAGSGGSFRYCANPTLPTASPSS